MRYARAVDANQPAIVEALRKAGATVEIIEEPCDLLVGFRGCNYVLEVKDGTKKPSARKLTPQQERFFATWRGHPPAKVETIEEAFAAVGINATKTEENK